MTTNENTATIEELEARFRTLVRQAAAASLRDLYDIETEIAEVEAAIINLKGTR